MDAAIAVFLMHTRRHHHTPLILRSRHRSKIRPLLSRSLARSFWRVCQTAMGRSTGTLMAMLLTAMTAVLRTVGMTAWTARACRTTRSWLTRWRRSTRTVGCVIGVRPWTSASRSRGALCNTGYGVMEAAVCPVVLCSGCRLHGHVARSTSAPVSLHGVVLLGVRRRAAVRCADVRVDSEEYRGNSKLTDSLLCARGSPWSLSLSVCAGAPAAQQQCRVGGGADGGHPPHRLRVCRPERRRLRHRQPLV